jgi:hypothetical protein
MLAEKFIEAHGLKMTATALTPEVTDGRLTHRWECRINSDDGVAQVFAYQMGDGHREERTITRSGSLWARYNGPLPTKYADNGDHKFWPRGTVVADTDRFQKTRCRTPDLREVLECLAMDARSVSEEYGEPDVREWAQEMGFTDGFEAMDIHAAIQANNRKLRVVLGRAKFAELLTIEEEV